MTEKIQKFYGSLKGKKVAFIGAGVTNKTCIELFAKHGAIVTLCDKKKSVEEFGDYGQTLKELDIDLSLGENYLDGLSNKDMIMRTPGFEYFTKELQSAKENGAVISSEMELFFELCPCKIIAVTGSDGKTTTTTLIAKMLEAAGEKVHLGGNLGRALLPVAESISINDWAVVELSSFQLISMKKSPHIAVVTNVTPNHLDHHKDMQEYIDAKRNILLYQSKEDKAVLGFENEITKNMEKDVKGEICFFSRKSKLDNGAYLNEDGVLVFEKDSLAIPIAHKDDIALRGEHNIENVLCAAAAVFDLIDVQFIAEVACSFAGVEHRIEPVRNINGVQWYNDSIATSPTRVIAGLKAFNQKMIIIAGGSDKHISFAPLVPYILENVKIIILMGATADKIKKAILESPDYNKSGLKIISANGMENAVQIAHENAKKGDIVSLSPACASFDSYGNFEERGKHFKRLVNAL